MKRMRRFTYVLALLALAGLGLAQTPTQDSHTVKVIIPQLLKVEVNAQEVVFDFGDQSVGNGSLTVGGNSYDRASEANYAAFLASGAPSKDFASTRVDLGGSTNANFVTLTVISNQDQWTVSVAPDPGSTLDAPLDNTRIKVYAESPSGSSGSSLTTSGPVPLSNSNSVGLVQATSGGRGRSEYNIYHLLELQSSDAFPTGYTSTVTLVYTITSP